MTPKAISSTALDYVSYFSTQFQKQVKPNDIKNSINKFQSSIQDSYDKNLLDSQKYQEKLDKL